MKRLFKHKSTGQEIWLEEGVSFWYFFFGFLYPAVKQCYMTAFGSVVLHFTAALLHPGLWLILFLVGPLAINKIMRKELEENGFVEKYYE